jgi:hypothetical protein
MKDVHIILESVKNIDHLLVETFSYFPEENESKRELGEVSP